MMNPWRRQNESNFEPVADSANLVRKRRSLVNMLNLVDRFRTERIDKLMGDIHKFGVDVTKAQCVSEYRAGRSA